MIRLSTPAPQAEMPKASTTPRTSPPSTAPGKLPRPPRVAAVNANNPAVVPEAGEMLLLYIPTSTPASPPSAEASMNEMFCTRPTGMPICSAASESWAVARIARP